MAIGARRGPRLRTTAWILFTLAWSLPALAAVDDGLEDDRPPQLLSVQHALELRSRAARLHGANFTNYDTTWVGYTPGHQGPGNWWSIYSGFGKDGFYRPYNGQPHKGVWNFDTPVNGDSLQGWWPMLNLYTATGSQTRSDRNRPWWAIDQGNTANYRINQANGRTFGVVGVWHRDGGSLQPAPPPRLTPGWTPAQGSWAAWMGLRAHGDVANLDPITNNPFNEDVLEYSGFSALSMGGNDQGFPGYGSQMDQMLYRDIDLSGHAGEDLTLRFQFRTVMSTGANTIAATRTGWFDSDPLGEMYVFPTNPQLSNFISSTDAGDALAPRDSFMVYVGKGVESQWLPAAANFGQSLPARPVYDKQRRWFGEVLRWDRDPGSPPGSPRPLHYKEVLSVTGVWPARADTANPGWVDTTFVIPALALPALSDSGRIRLVFRVKTNRGFDDQGTQYTSNARGAAVVDRVSYRFGAGPEVVFGDFEDAADIDNDVAVPAVQKWKSTGKPPSGYAHVHLFADLEYEDLCGVKGDLARQCNMSGLVISVGDHDRNEASSGLAGTADRERMDAIVSPTICFADDDGDPETPNVIGLYGFAGYGGIGDISADEDYYVVYDYYSGALDPFTTGNVMDIAVMSYPGSAKASHGSYPAWGQLRPGFIQFSTDKQCLTNFVPVGGYGSLRTSNANGIPDSIRIMVRKFQQCFRFGVTTGCATTDGLYFDNISLAIVDGIGAPLHVGVWDWVNDAFPANETPGLPASAAFDTAAAHVMTGRNIAQSSNNLNRYDVPGDSVLVQSANGTARVDMVFRILPGPGNYEPVGRPDLGTVVRRPDSRALVTKGDGSFWDSYRQTPGDFASPNAVTLHHNAPGGWDPNVWNSARCDTAEFNLFARQAPGSGNALGGPPWAFDWMSTYHESDPHYATLGIVKNRCFVTGPSDPITSVTCNGTVPSYISSRSEHSDVTGTTKEFTKIIPDGLLTPGAHVEYFFRAQNVTAPGSASAVLPDTNRVIQPDEGSTDGHRWQQFGVLPNRWKNPTYKHPVTATFGYGSACLLVADANDRRGNERVWVGIADTIGATPQRWWGAHNGWHAVGGGDVDDPADNRRHDGSTGFTSEHLGQPGSGGSWDMYQIKAAESPTNRAGSLGSRKANRSGGAGQQIVIAKSSRQGPTTEMLNTFYRMMLFLSGDLNNGVLGPYNNHSQNDVGLITEWLDSGSSGNSRAFWAIGDGFAEALYYSPTPAVNDFLANYLWTDLVHEDYREHTGNLDELAHLRLLPGWQNAMENKTAVQLFGVRSTCLWTNDVLQPNNLNATNGVWYNSRTDNSGSYLAPASVYGMPFFPDRPIATLVDGWDIEHLTHPADVHTVDRSGYFYKLFFNAWSQVCFVRGAPLVPLEVPGMDLGPLDFASVRNNPLTRGSATIRFGLARADRVEIKIYDVGGRLVRTLADRRFGAGTHDLEWDGADDHGRAVPRGVYFTRVRYTSSGFMAARKVTVLQ